MNITGTTSAIPISTDDGTLTSASGGTVGVRLEPDPSTRLELRSDGSSMEVTATGAGGLPGVRIEVDLAEAVGYWQPGGRGERVLPADWSGSTTTSLVRSAPIGAVYDASGRVILGWAADEAIAELKVSAGVSEERKTFVVHIRPVRPLPRPLGLLIDRSGRPLTEVVPRLAGWLSSQWDGAPLSAPDVAKKPVWSTWYTFSQDIDHELVTAEASLAARLGYGSIFIDDGWQRFGHGRGYQGCGDWLPDETKFPDLPATTSALRAEGLAVALWIAPLLLGPDSAAFSSLHRFAPHVVPGLNCHVLDPRYPEVRTFVADTCVRLVQRYGADILKIDFLDQAEVYTDAAGQGDLADTGVAMARLLAQLRRRLADVGRSDVAFEFRQPYVSPAIARFGEILRANDCPGDSVLNRQCTIDARLVAVGQVVHSDPMMWGTSGGAAAVAQQLLSAWFSVPQISMRLTGLSAEQSNALQGLLGLWQEHADVTLHGDLTIAGAERGYDLVCASRPDLGRAVIVRYAALVVDLDDQPVREVTILNATPDVRLVVRTQRPIDSGIVRSASAVSVVTVGPLAPGLVEIAVPAWGSTTLHLSASDASRS